MPFSKTEQRLALVVAEAWLVGGVDARLHPRNGAFKAAEGQYEASICHRFEGIAASRRLASEA